MKSSNYQTLRNALGPLVKQEYIDKTTGGKCECCGDIYPVDVMEFHHKEPVNKRFGLDNSRWCSKAPSQRTLDEAAKCVILCSNCHRLEHVALKRGESILNDEETYSRYRNYRPSHKEWIKGVDGWHLRSQYKQDTQLLLSI